MQCHGNTYVLFTLFCFFFNKSSRGKLNDHSWLQTLNAGSKRTFCISSQWVTRFTPSGRNTCKSQLSNHNLLNSTFFLWKNTHGIAVISRFKLLTVARKQTCVYTRQLTQTTYKLLTQLFWFSQVQQTDRFASETPWKSLSTWLKWDFLHPADHLTSYLTHFKDTVGRQQSCQQKAEKKCGAQETKD